MKKIIGIEHQQVRRSERGDGGRAGLAREERDLADKVVLQEGDFFEAAEKVAREMIERLDACARRIFSAPPQSQADILLLAEVCFRTLWTGGSLHDSDADARRAEGPENAIGSPTDCI